MLYMRPIKLKYIWWTVQKMKTRFFGEEPFGEPSTYMSVRWKPISVKNHFGENPLRWKPTSPQSLLWIWWHLKLQQSSSLCPTGLCSQCVFVSNSVLKHFKGMKEPCQVEYATLILGQVSAQSASGNFQVLCIFFKKLPSFTTAIIFL